MPEHLPCPTVENDVMNLFVVLQLLQRASQYNMLPDSLIEPVLTMFLEQDALSADGQMVARSHDLLTMLKQAAGTAWPQALQPATVSLLAGVLLHQPGHTDITEM